MTIIKSILIFLLAGICEIGGGYLIWLWLKEGKPVWYGIIGGFILALYGVVATLQTANFARVYATYGKNNIQLSKGIVLPYDVFDDVYVDTGLYFFSKNKAQSSFVYEYSSKDKVSLDSLNNLAFKEIQNTEWQNTSSLKIVFNAGIRNIQSKFSKLETTIGDITKSVRGILADSSDYSIKEIDSTYKSVFTGKLDRYSIDNEFMFVKYGENLKEKPLSEDYFKGERILIRRIISRQFRVMATITDQDFVNKKDIYVFKLNDTEFASKYLLAIINSKLISFLKTNASNSAKKDDFTQLTLGDIREIRIPRISVKSQAEYVKQVDKIISNKIKGNDTNELESNLDLMIYKLYDLSENEIKTVEGN